MKLAPFFNTSRMVQEYTEDYYAPVYEKAHQLVSPDITPGLAYAAWREALSKDWPAVSVKDVSISAETVSIGVPVQVSATVTLGDLKPADVSVQLYFSALNSSGELREDGEWVNMVLESSDGSEHRFKGSVTYVTSGDRGVSVRVLPANPNLSSPFEPRLIRWA